MNNENLIVKMIENSQAVNSDEHNSINRRLDITNGNIAKIKKHQIYLRGILIGITATLFIFGFLPERIYNLLAMIF